MAEIIKDTVDIYCFCKNWYETAQEHMLMLFKLPPVSLNQIEKFLHISFRTVENFSTSKPRPPGQRKLDENPTPGEVRTCESRGVAQGEDGQAWNWLIHKIYKCLLWPFCNCEHCHAFCLTSDFFVSDRKVLGCRFKQVRRIQDIPFFTVSFSGHFLGTYADINLTGYHPPTPGWPPGHQCFPSKSPPPGQLSSAKLRPRVEKTKQKSPPLDITCLVRTPRYQWKRNIIL